MTSEASAGNAKPISNKHGDPVETAPEATRSLHFAVFVFGPAVAGEDGYSVNSGFHRLLPVLVDHGHQVDLCIPVLYDPQKPARERISPRVSVIPLPGFSGGAEFYGTKLPLMWIAVARLLWKNRRRWDVVCLVDAEIMTQFACVLCKAWGINAFVFHRARIDLMLHWHTSGPVRKALAWLFGRWHAVAIPMTVRALPAVVTGGELYRMYAPLTSKIHQFVTSSVRAESAPSPIEDADRTAAGAPWILTVSRISPEKRIEDVIHAMAIVRKKFPATLTIVGPGQGEYFEMLRDLIQSFGLEEAVHFTGQIPAGPELWQAYRSSTIFVQASLSEGTPRTVMEAMSEGVPVVATTVGGIPDLVTDGQQGFLVPPKNVDQLAAAICRILTDPELAEHMSDSGRRRASELNIDNQVEELVTFLRACYPNLCP